MKNTDFGADAILDVHGENAAAVDTGYDIDHTNHDCSDPHSPCNHDHERSRGSREYVNSLNDWHWHVDQDNEVPAVDIPVDIPVHDDIEL